MRESEMEPVTFAEIPLMSQKISASDSFQADAIIRSGDVIVGISNSISDRLLEHILEVTKYARWSCRCKKDHHCMWTNRSSKRDWWSGPNHRDKVWSKHHLKKTYCFFSVADEAIASKDSCGKAMDSCFCINVWKMALFPGHAPRKKQCSSHRSSTRCWWWDWIPFILKYGKLTRKKHFDIVQNREIFLCAWYIFQTSHKTKMNPLHCWKTAVFMGFVQKMNLEKLYIFFANMSLESNLNNRHFDECADL